MTSAENVRSTFRLKSCNCNKSKIAPPTSIHLLLHTYSDVIYIMSMHVRRALGQTVFHAR